MSRWYVTSSAESYRRGQLAGKNAGLRVSGQISGRGLFGESYYKRVTTSTNLVHIEENAWICSAGTLVYNGKIGEEALCACYSDFVAGGVSRVQSTAVGHYALAIRHGDTLSIFTDPQGSLNLYYLREGHQWFVSNSLSLCATISSNRKIDSTKLLISALQNNLPGEDTFYSGIEQLFGTQLIRINLVSGNFEVERIPEAPSCLSWKLPTIEEAVEQYAEEVRSVFKDLTTAGSIGLFATGGLDSRTVLAGILDQKAPCHLMYGIGDTRLTDYDLRDVECAQMVANCCGLPFQKLNWAGSQPFSDDVLQGLFGKFGFPYEVYSGSDAFLQSIGGGIKPYPDIFLGGYSPAFANSKPWELTKTLFTFDDVVTDTTSHFQRGRIENSHCVTHTDVYREVVAAEVKAAMECAGFEVPAEGFPLEMFVKAKLFMYIRSDSRFVNFANEFCHYAAPFLMKRLYDPLLDVPLRYRANDEFQLRVIHALTPSLTDVPLFSGWSLAHTDPQTFRLVRDRDTVRKSLVRRVARRILPSMLRAPLRSAAYHIQRKKPEAKPRAAERDLKITRVYGEAVMNHPLGERWFTSLDEFTPKEITRLRHYLMGVDTLGYSE